MASGMLTPAADRSRARLRPAAPAAGLALLLLTPACAGRREERGPEPVYCYRTLADVTCRTVPDPGREGRLVGVYLRYPDDPAWPDHWLQRPGALTTPVAVRRPTLIRRGLGATCLAVRPAGWNRWSRPALVR